MKIEIINESKKTREKPSSEKVAENKFKPVILTSAYRKSLKNVSKWPAFSEEKLNSYIEMKSNGQQLPNSAKDHRLSSDSEYKGQYNFHIAPDILVLYRPTDTSIELLDIGSHSSLKMKDTCRI